MRRRGKQCSSWSRPHASWRSWPFWRESAGGDRDPDRHVGRRSSGGRHALRRGARAPSSQARPGYDETVKVRKAVFPAAGLGTRFLPATKAQPKEMLALVDKPLIQYVIEEAVLSGIRNITIVTGRGKNAIEDHFDVSYELEKVLESRGKSEQLEEIRKISNMVNVTYVRQKEALGLGHAILTSRDSVGHEPFAVMLGDDIIDSEVPCLQRMIELFEKLQSSIIAI